MTHRGITLIIVLLGVSLLAGAASAQNAVEEFYRGRQINLIIGYGPGGGYDLVGRLLARHLGRYLPGHPTIVAQNMPGAGSLRAVNYLYSVAPRDGTTFGLFGSDMALIGLIGGNSNIQFDPRKFTWLGSSSSFAGDAYVLMVRPGAQAKSIAEARRLGGPPLVLAGTGEGARDADVPKILRDALALNVKQVLGYPDTPSIFLAVERGEVDGRTFDRMMAQTPIRTKSGTVRITDSKVFPVSTTIAAALVEVAPGAMRELHWHPNTDEWQYYIEGQARMGVFAALGQARTFDFQANDVGYVPFAMGHYIENTGNTMLRFLETFKSGYYADVSLDQWLALTPPELVGAHLKSDPQLIRALRKDKVPVVPA